MTKTRLVKLIILLVLALIAIGGYYYGLYFPSTHNAFIRAKVTPIAPQLGGRITRLYASNNHFVHQGDKILQIDPSYYQLELTNANNEVALARAKLATLKIQLAVSSDELAAAQADYDKAKKYAGRIGALAKRNNASQEQLSSSERALSVAKAKLDEAGANKRLLEQQLGSEGNATLRLRQAKNDLKIAHYNLSKTTILAESDGYLTNFEVTRGTDVNAGQSLGAIIASNSWWVQANFKETDLAKIKIGDKATIEQRSTGEHYAGTVMFISPGIARGKTNPDSGLIQTKPENNWVSLAQRIPVRIRFEHLPKTQRLIVGSSVNVSIDSSSAK